MRHKVVPFVFVILLAEGILFSLAAQTPAKFKIQKYDFTSGTFIFNSTQNFYHSSSLGAGMATGNVGEISFLSSGFWASPKFSPEIPIGVLTFLPAHEFEVSLFPNPIEGDARIRFTCSESLELSIHVYLINGAKHNILLEKCFESGEHEVHFTREQLGLAPGVYIMEFIASDPGKSNPKYRSLLKTVVTN